MHLQGELREWIISFSNEWCKQEHKELYIEHTEWYTIVIVVLK